MSRIAKRLGLQAIDTHMGLFDFTVRCVIGEQTKALEYVAHVFEEKYEELPDGNRGYEARGVCYYRTGYVPIVWIPRKPETPREHATLAHEVIHAINHLFDWSATPLSRDTEETFAHAVAHVLNNIYDNAEILEKAIQNMTLEDLAQELPRLQELAKALWGNGLIDDGDGFNFVTNGKGQRCLTPAWKLRLQQMVIDDDPIEYLGANL